MTVNSLPKPSRPQNGIDKVKIRPALDTDVDALVELQDVSLVDSWHPKTWDEIDLRGLIKRTKRPRLFVRVADLHGDILAASFVVLTDYNAHIIERLCTWPGTRRRGLASLLIADVQRRSTQNSIDLYARCHEANTDGLACYKKQGFDRFSVDAQPDGASIHLLTYVPFFGVGGAA